jgi:hypothetical protein
MMWDSSEMSRKQINSDNLPIDCFGLLACLNFADERGWKDSRQVEPFVDFARVGKCSMKATCPLFAQRFVSGVSQLCCRLSEVTVKKHRGNAMRKMKAESLPEMVKMAARLRLRRATADAGLAPK